MAGVGDIYGLGKLFQRAKAGPGRVAAQDPQEQNKRQRFRALKQIQVQKGVQRSRKTLSSKSIWSQLRHSDRQSIHPLWDYLPKQERTFRKLTALRRSRLWAWFKQRRQLISALLMAYVVFWSLPLLFGEPLMTVFAVLPLILVPPVGYLVYWLVWKEFHE
jgi:Flp pilus assembly protein TadB